MEVGESSKVAETKDLQGQKEVAGKDGTQEDAMNQYGVKVKIEEEDGSSEDHNDFDVIV